MSPSFVAVIVTNSALRHCTDGVLNLLKAKFETHIIRGPQKANERVSEVAEMRGPRGGTEGPRVNDSLNDSWKAKGVSKKRPRAIPAILVGNCWEKSSPKLVNFPPQW